MHQKKMILTFGILCVLVGLGLTVVVYPSVRNTDVPKPTPQGLPDEFTPLPNRGVVNNELNHYEAYNSQMDDFMQLEENPGIDYSVSQDARHIEGSFSVRLSYRNYGKARFASVFYQNNDTIYPPNIRENATFAFNWYLESMDNTIAEQDYVRINIALNDSTPRYLRYYLGGYMAQDTNSYGLNVTGHNTTANWIYSWRNLTQDYLDRWGSFSQDIGIVSIQVEIDQARYRDVPIVTYLDNMSVIINDINRVRNGDFETLDAIQRPDEWEVMNLGQEYNPASIKHVSSGMNDTHAVNISSQVVGVVANRGILSYADLAVPWLEENRTASNCSDTRPMKLILNYKIENVPKTEDAWAQLKFTFNNYTDDHEINFHFYNTLFSTYGVNDTAAGVLNIMLDNRTNMWLTADVDLWPLLSTLSYGGPSQLVGLHYEVICYGDANDNFTIILDNMGLQTTTFTDAQFEHPPAASGAIGGWVSYNSQCKMNYTTSAYSGIYAANFTKGKTYSSGAFYCFYPTFGLTKGLIFETDYRVSALPGHFTDSVTLAMYLLSYDGTQDMKAISYTLAIYDTSQVSGNGTISGRFMMDNITGQWCHLERNLHDDFHLLFPDTDPEDYYINIIAVILSSFQDTIDLTLLLDNTNLKIANDPDPPRITSVTIYPSPPKAGTPLTVTAQVIDDGIGVQAVTLMYSTDTGTSWHSKVMTSCGSNSYCATIENLAENSILSYYVIATDQFGNTAQSTTGGASTMVVVVPSFSFWEAFLIGAIVAGGALVATFVAGKVRQAKKAKAGRAGPPAGLTSVTKPQ